MISQLVDMEWKFGVTASTNTINNYGNAFLQLKLIYKKDGRLESSVIGDYFKILKFNFEEIF
jgi:COMM domain containing 7